MYKALLFLSLLTSAALADNVKETDISIPHCEQHLGGVAEFRLQDGSRVDCLTDTQAIEHDWGKGLKPYECIGQALYYAQETGREPMCVLIRPKLGQFFIYARRAIVTGVEVMCIDTDMTEFDCITGEK